MQFPNDFKYEPVCDFDSVGPNHEDFLFKKLGNGLKKAWTSTAGKVVRKVGGLVLDIIPVTSIAKGVIELGVDVGKGIHKANQNKKAKKKADEENARKKALLKASGQIAPIPTGYTEYVPTIDFENLGEATARTFRVIQGEDSIF